MTRDAAVAHGEADELALDAVADDALERRTADEVAGLGELHDAGEARLERVGRAVELVAVQRHAGLEPERVAGPEAHGHLAVRAPRLEQRVPQLPHPIDVDEQLEAVLAGVAGAGDLHRDPGHDALGDPVVADRRQVELRQRSEDVERARPLDRDEPGREGAVVEDGAEALEPLGERVRHDPRVRRVGDDHEPVLGQAVDDQVVEDPAVGGADHRVVRPAHGEGRRVGHERAGEGRARIVALRPRARPCATGRTGPRRTGRRGAPR